MEEALAKLWKSDLPTGRSGDWAVERFQIRRDPPPDSLLEGLRGYPDSKPPLRGIYTRLKHQEMEIMSDIQDEWAAHRQAALQAARRGGRVLVHGLGLGLIVEVMLRNPFSHVEQLTVIERSPDVIRLVGTHLQARYGKRLRIVRADAFGWQPPENVRYQVVWHDIWERIDPHNLEAMDLLEGRYRCRCDWQGSWSREYIEKHMREANVPGLLPARFGD